MLSFQNQATVKIDTDNPVHKLLDFEKRVHLLLDNPVLCRWCDWHRNRHNCSRTYRRWDRSCSCKEEVRLHPPVDEIGCVFGSTVRSVLLRVESPQLLCIK